jgi:hypothetical protein
LKDLVLQNHSLFGKKKTHLKILAMKNLAIIFFFIGIMFLPVLINAENHKNDPPIKESTISKPDSKQLISCTNVTVSPEVTITDCPLDCQAQYCTDLWLEIWSDCGPTFIEALQINPTQCKYTFSSFVVDDSCNLYVRIVDRGSPPCAAFNQQISSAYPIPSGGGIISMSHHVCYP